LKPKKSKNNYKDKINRQTKKPESRNITFSFSKDLLSAFKKECESNDRKMNQIVEEMIKDYIK
jgi:hypothetical protein